MTKPLWTADLTIRSLENNMGVLSLSDLPDEILRSICLLVDWKDVVSLQFTSSRFSGITQEYLLWRHLCRKHFRYWDDKHDFLAKWADPSFLEWKELFKERYRAQYTTAESLEYIIDEDAGRLPDVQALTAIGFDAKDVLLENYHAESKGEDYLARR